MGYEGTGNMHLNGNTSASTVKVDSFMPLVSHANSESASCSRTDSELTFKRIGHSTKNSDSSDTVVSSSSNSLSDDYIQVDPRLFSKSNAPNNIPKSKVGEIDVANEAFFGLEKSIDESPESTSRFPDITFEYIVPPTISPPVQVMERPTGFDSSRIPNSIFSRPVSPMDWSVASNESLFSIHFGNNSFSRDHGSRPGEKPKSVNVFKSVELHQTNEPYKREELHPSSEVHRPMELSKEIEKSNDAKKSDELNRFGRITSTSRALESSSVHNATKMNEDIRPIAKETNDECANDFANINHQVESNRRETVDSSRVNRHSVVIEKRIPLVALPKKKKSFCSDCSWAFLCCKLPTHCCKGSICPWNWVSRQSCTCKWFNCTSSKCCFKCPTCQCKCLSWPRCHCKCPTWSGCCWMHSSLPKCNCKCLSLSSYCCKCHIPSCSWTCCCMNNKPKRVGYDTSYISKAEDLTSHKKGNPQPRHTMDPKSTKPSQRSSRREFSCFSCSSSCPCCSCFSCSCCW